MWLNFCLPDCKETDRKKKKLSFACTMSPSKTRTHNEDIDEDVSSGDEEMVLEENQEMMETDEANQENADVEVEEAIVPADKIEIVSY
jgi:hypothetical protein